MASRETVRPPRELPLRPQDEVECRRCEVHCDKVVYPSACVARSCPFLYAYEEFGRTYVGCMQKVYSVEIDLELLQEAEERKPGFGAVRANRKPLPMCHAEVESTYLEPGRRPRLREPRVPRAARRRPELPRFRAGARLRVERVPDFHSERRFSISRSSGPLPD